MRFAFCPRCGGETAPRWSGGREREYCPACDHVYFHNPVAAAAAVIIEGGRILLCRRNSSVFRGRWYIPAGFCEEDESIEQCAVREVKEETGLDATVVGRVDANSGFEVAGRPVVGIYFRVEVMGGVLTPGDDVDAAEFFPLAPCPTCHLPPTAAWSRSCGAAGAPA